MLNIEMMHNPYRVITEIIVNGEALPATHSLIQDTKNKRIQVWIDNLFIRILEELNDDQACIHVRCIPQDAEDVKSAYHNFKKTSEGQYCRMDLSFDEDTQSSADKIERLKSLLEEAKCGPFDEFRDDKLQKSFAKALDPKFEVNVVATMSSGKSTLINAFIGQEIMPAKNEACTATIGYIEKDASIDGFLGKCTDKDGQIAHDWQGVDYNALSNWNEDDNISTIHVKGDIKAIRETKDAQLVLVDTPGPNNSRDDSHKRMTYKAIRDETLSMVLYILNATQLNINDDAMLLKDVAETMCGNRQAQDRFIFVANKIDAFDPEKGESVEHALRNVRAYLQKNGIDNPTIIPASSELAKLIRMSIAGKSLTRSQKGNLTTFQDLFLEEAEMNMLRHARPFISAVAYKNLENKFNKATTDEEKAEILSGIPIVEELLNEFLVKHAMPAKIKDAVDCFDGVMRVAKGIEIVNEQLDQDEAALKLAVDNLTKLASSKDKIDFAKKYREKVRELKYQPSQELQKSIESVQKNYLELTQHLTKFFSSQGVEKHIAQYKINQAINDCKHFNLSIEKIINDALVQEYALILNRFREEYEQGIASLLEKAFPDTNDHALVTLQKQVLSMPNAKKMMSAYGYEKEIEVGRRSVSDSRWWNPFSWGRTKTVIDYETKDFVDMGKVWDEIREELTLLVRKSRTMSEKQAIKQLEDAKNITLKAMDGIDAKWNETLAEMQQASKSKEEKERIIQVNKHKLAWYDDFQTKLQNILSI